MTNAIILIGRNSLFNDLLCSSIHRKTNIPCETISEWGELLKLASEPADGKALLLIDSSGTDLEDFFTCIKEFPEQRCNDFIPALFNLERGGEKEPLALKNGVKGFFYRDEDLKVLLRGIQALFDGETWIPRSTLLDIALRNARPVDAESAFNGWNGLTHRETEILANLSAGATNEEIADRMCISTHTVKAHLYNIYKKIRVDNRFQAALWATKHL